MSEDGYDQQTEIEILITKTLEKKLSAADKERIHQYIRDDRGVDDSISLLVTVYEISVGANYSNNKLLSLIRRLWKGL